MPDARVLALLRHAGTAPSAADRPDADLLARFLDRHDEAAFEALVRRHGPMVRAVCRAALRNPADVDDAFQATFLVLVRRAGAVRDRAAVGGWLYRVAHRVSRKVRAGERRRAPLPDDVPARAADGPGPDVRLALDEEVGRLPERYRVVVQLCYGAGHTTADAARRLGWAKGTVLTRLAWARKRLRTQLRRRGVMAAGGLVAAFAGRPAVVDAGLVAGTVRAAVAAAAGDGLVGVVSGRVLTLTDGVVRVMTLNKLKWLAGAAFLTAALTGVGVGRWTANTATADPGDKKRVAAVEPDRPAPPAKDEPVAAAEAKPGPAAKPEPPTRPLAGRSDATPLTADAGPAKTLREFTVARPIGTWVREVATEDAQLRITLKFDEDRLTGIVEKTFEGGSVGMTVSIEADYALNKESVVYGVVTSVVYDGPDNRTDVEAELNGQPFAFRFRADEKSLTVKDPKALGAMGGVQDDRRHQWELLALGCGRYAATDGKPTATPKPVRPAPRRVNRTTAPNFPDVLIPQPGGLIPGPIQPGGPLLPGLPPGAGGSSHLAPEHLRGASISAACGEPTDAEILKAVPKLAGGCADGVTIVKSRIAGRADPVKFVPCVGPARLHHDQWECAVYYTETVPSAEPFPTIVRKPRVKTVYVAKDRLEPVAAK